MAESKKTNDRVESEARAIVRTTNNDLVCKDCIFRHLDDVVFGNTSKCEQYPVKKPNWVLLGGKCNEYVKQ